MQDADLASAAEELYALSPGDFTAARDERVAQARTSGNRDLARAIGALRRPTVSAWLVNQVVREAGDQVGELLALGESLRQAQRDLAGEQVRELSARRRQLVAGLVAEAKRLAERDGRPAGLQVEREVEATLQAALADADAAAAVRAGCLASPLSYAGLGVGDEAGAVSWQRAPARQKTPAGDEAEKAPARKAPAPKRAGGRRSGESAEERAARLADEEAERKARQAEAEAERRAAKIAEAEQAVRRATDAVAAAEADLTEAEAKFTSTRAAQESARQQVERLDRELSRAIAAESQANRAARDAQRGKEAAARAADEAKRRLARAQTAAHRLG